MRPLPNAPNGLVCYTEKDIFYREFLIVAISSYLRQVFKDANRAIEFMRVETPCLVPTDLVQDHITSKFPLWCALPTDGEMWAKNQPEENVWLRPESTKGTYQMFDVLFPQDQEFLKHLPLCLWQSGLSFRVEQDKTFSHLRFKQFYQLEFQIAYSSTTKADYHTIAVQAMQKFLRQHFALFACRTEQLNAPDLPFYSDLTTDLYLSDGSQEWEVIAISKRKDFKVPILEISCGLDRLTHLIQQE